MAFHNIFNMVITFFQELLAYLKKKKKKIHVILYTSFFFFIRIGYGVWINVFILYSFCFLFIYKAKNKTFLNTFFSFTKFFPFGKVSVIVNLFAFFYLFIYCGWPEQQNPLDSKFSPFFS